MTSQSSNSMIKEILREDRPKTGPGWGFLAGMISMILAAIFAVGMMFFTGPDSEPGLWFALWMIATLGLITGSVVTMMVRDLRKP